MLASMGTVNIFDGGDRGCSLGHTWAPEKYIELKQYFVQNKIPLNHQTSQYDPKGEPGADESDYTYCPAFWLEYYICKATARLNPVSMNYRDPTMADANECDISRDGSSDY